MDDKSNSSLKADDENERLLDSRKNTKSKEEDLDDSQINEEATVAKTSKPQQDESKNVSGKDAPRAYKADVWYLIGYTLTLGLSSMQFSLALGGTGQASQFLRYQLNWGNDPEALDFFSTVLSTAGIVGISIGSLYGGDFTQGGRRKTVLYFNALALLGTALSFVLHFKVMCFGRFLFGLAAGVLLCATPKIMEETIPPALIDLGFGSSTNVLMCFFGCGQLLLSFGMPARPEELATSRYWMVIYGMQAPFCLLALYMHAFVYVEEPIDFCIKMDRREEALRLIAKVYRWESPEVHQRIYEEKCAQLQVGTQQQAGRPVDNERGGEAGQEPAAGEQEESVWHALTDPGQRGASWMSIVIAIFNNLSGIGIVNIYSICIFETIQRKGAVSRLTPIQDSYYVGFSGFLGAVLSYYTVSLLSRRAIFIGGHFCMAVLLFATAYFVHSKQVELVLVTLCAFIVVFQATQGTVIFIYISEIVSSEAAMGLALFALMICLTAQAMFGPLIMSSKLGVDGMFFVLAVIHVAAFTTFYFFLKETQGLSQAEKKKLYAAKVVP